MTESKKARHQSTDHVDRKSVTGHGCMVRVVHGPDRGRECAITSAVVIGKAPGSDLVLTDPTVSASHARIEAREDGLHVSDLGSTNGTYYLETRVRDVVVAPGGVLSLGQTRIALMPHGGVADASVARNGYGAILGASPAMQPLYALLHRLEGREHTVLVLGETGVGKELVAGELHRNSPRKNGPLVVFDASAVTANLLESQLFGHVRGAFTGAANDTLGLFERARGGTIFLDEIGELPLDLQPRLLRVLESRTIRRVGSAETRDVDVRVVAATNRDLASEVERGRFREDLYYRLQVLTVEVPPLRSRPEDIPVLVQHFCKQLTGGEISLSESTLNLFQSGYSWPGNVRELRNAVERVLTVGALPEALSSTPPTEGERPAGVEVDLTEPLLEAKRRVSDGFERDYLVNQLRRARDNISEAARLSGMDRSYFKRLLRRHNLRWSE